MSMVLDVRDLRGVGGRVDWTCPVGALPAEAADEYTVVSDVALMLRVRKDGDKYRIVGGVRTDLRLSCCRCLDPFEVPREMSVDLLYLPQTANKGEADSEVSDEDLSTAFYRDQQIDLAHMVREQLQLSMPMKPLCHDECRGLCPMCGTNLNIEPCSCDARWRDPRFAALERLIRDHERR